MQLTQSRIGLYEKALPAEMIWEEKIAVTQSLGFDFIELSIDESEEKRARLDWSAQEIMAIRQWCQHYQLPIQSLCLSAHRKYPFGSADPQRRQQAIIHMQKGIDLAYKLGIRTIQLAGYDVYYEPASTLSHQRFIEGMKASVKMAEQAGVMLAVEIMDTEYLNSLTKFEILKREIPSPFFMAYPDVGNISGWNYDPCVELNLSRDHIVQIHLKDSLKVTPQSVGQFRDLVIGEGEVDFVAIFKLLKQINYVAPFVIEMWANDSNWRENIVLAKQRLCQASLQAQFPLFTG